MIYQCRSFWDRAIMIIPVVRYLLMLSLKRSFSELRGILMNLPSNMNFVVLFLYILGTESRKLSAIC